MKVNLKGKTFANLMGRRDLTPPRRGGTPRPAGFCSCLLMFAVGSVALGAFSATYSDPFVLSGGYTLQITENSTVTASATISGTGDFHVKATDSYQVDMYGANTANGDFYVDSGIINVFSSSVLGTGTVYVNDETGSVNRRQLHLRGDQTVTNAIVLGSEATTGWQERFTGQGGNITLNGPISANGSKIGQIGGTMNIRGGITGESYATLYTMQNSDGLYPGFIQITDRPITLGGALQIQGPGFDHLSAHVYLGTPGNAFSQLTLFGFARLVCGADNAFASAAPLYGYSGGGTIDLNGHDLSLGAIVTGGAPNAPLRVVNGNVAEQPSLSLAQNLDIADGQLELTGRFNFTKTGGGTLGTSGTVSLEGTLEVAGGTFVLNGNPTMMLAEIVRLSGGTLDLGGKTWRCGVFDYVSGSIVNGTLHADRQIVRASGDYSPSASITGAIELASAGSVNFGTGNASSSAQVATDYAVPAGTVCYFPFDSADPRFLLKDYGSAGVQLVRGPDGSGTAVFSPESSQGTAGALYLDGTAYLQATAFPEGMSSEAGRYTASFWFKAADGCPDSATVLGWGTAASEETKYQSVNFMFVNWGGGSFSLFDQCYYGADMAIPLDNGRTYDDGWHHVVGVWDGATSKMFVDGVKKADWFVCSPQVGTNFFRIGSGTIPGAPAYKGWIDEVLILNRAVSDDEAIALFTTAPARTTRTIAPSVTVSSGALVSRANCVVWKFDSQAALFDDATGNGASLRPVEGASDDHMAFSASTAHEAGGSIHLDGKTYLTLAGNFPSQIPTGHSPVSICIRFKADADCFNGAGLVGWGAGEANYGNYCLVFNNWSADYYYKRLFFAWYGGQTAADLATGTFNDGNWHTAIATYDGSFQVGGGIRMYLDGTEITADTMWQYPAVTAENLTVGAIPYSRYADGVSPYNFKGLIDDVAIYPYALSAAQATAYHLEAPSAGGPFVPCPTTALTVSTGAVLSLPGYSGAVSSLAGAGSFCGESLTVSNALETGTSIQGSLSLADGICVTPGSGATTVSGTLAVLGGGSVQLPPTLTLPYEFTLLSATRITGEEHCQEWTVANLPSRNCIAKIKIRDGMISVKVSSSGMTMTIR